MTENAEATCLLSCELVGKHPTAAGAAILKVRSAVAHSCFEEC